LYIQNYTELTSHGQVAERKTLIDIIEYSLRAADPYVATKNMVRMKGNMLNVGDLHFDLSKRGNIYLLGAGKATYPIAKALEEILGEKLTDGIIIVKEGQQGTLRRVNLVKASHPLPDKRGYFAAQKMKAMAEQAKEVDIVFCAITGGSSALAPLPINGVSIEEKRKIHEVLLNSGATIREINTVRKHLSQIKGGKLALSVFPAELINLTVSDVIGDPLDYITDPTVPDTSTFADAISVLQHYELLNKIPKSAQKYLLTATQKEENPKDFTGKPLHTFIILKSDVPCEAAFRRAKELGFNSIVITTTLEGESKEMAHIFTGIAREMKTYERPFKSPCLIVGGGEANVYLKGRHGRGGPNQEMALSAALQFERMDGVVFAAIDTDGTDGLTNFAGGIVDSSTTRRASQKRLDLMQSLFSHDAATALNELGDAIKTGHTGTNVNDLYLMLVA